MESAPLRIAFIRQRYRSDGGAERFVARVLETLGGEGVEAWILARSWPKTPGVSRLRVDPYHLTRLQRDRGFAKAVRREIARRDFDLVQSHERIPGVPIYRAGDGVHREWLKQRERLRGKGGDSAWHRYTLDAERALFEHPKLRVVICNSTMVRDEILEHFDVPPDRLRVILNGVDGQRFRPREEAERQALRASLEMAADRIVTLFVGSGWERKGVAPLLDALARSRPEHELWIAGADRDGKRYRQRAEELGVSERVRFLGKRDDLPELLAAADLFALPTLYDPFPNAAFEAMAAGLPVITSTKSGARDLVTRHDAGFAVDALDVEALAHALRQLEDGDLRRQQGRRARAAVAELDDQRLATELRTLYDELRSDAS